MYITKVKAVIILVLMLLVSTQATALADSYTGKLLSANQIEDIHEGDNVKTVMVGIQEDDGDEWFYMADRSTNGKFKAMN